MKTYIMFLLLLPLPLSAVNENDLMDCRKRVEKKFSPVFPSNIANISTIEKYGRCEVKLELSIDESGRQSIIRSYVDNLDCSNFIRNARKTVEKYIFKKGISELCEVNVVFEFDSNGT